MLYPKTLRKVTLAIFPKFRLSMNEFRAATYGARCEHDFSAVLTPTTLTENSTRCDHDGRSNSMSSNVKRSISISKVYLIELDLSENNLCNFIYVIFNTYFYTIR